MDDKISKIIWCRQFIESQGLKINYNVIFQDNQSAIQVEYNGIESAGKRTRHFNINYITYLTLFDRSRQL